MKELTVKNGRAPDPQDVFSTFAKEFEIHLAYKNSSRVKWFYTVYNNRENKLKTFNF